MNKTDKLLTENEKLILAQILNGCNLRLERDPSWLGRMAGRSFEGSCLEWEVEDSMSLDGIGGNLLVKKIRSMTKAERERILRGFATAWENYDDQSKWNEAMASLQDPGDGDGSDTWKPIPSHPQG